MARCATTIDVSSKTVTRAISLKRDRNSHEFSFTTTINFNDCSDEQILEWASKNLIIDIQTKLRKCSDSFLNKLESTGLIINANAIEITDPEVERQRQRATAEKYISSMSSADAAELLAALQAKIGNSTN